VGSIGAVDMRTAVAPGNFEPVEDFLLMPLDGMADVLGGDV
jgi:hypothetical protein